MDKSEPVWYRQYPITVKHYYWVRSEINKLLDAWGNPQQPFLLISTYHCTAQGRWLKMCSDQL